MFDQINFDRHFQRLFLVWLVMPLNCNIFDDRKVNCGMGTQLAVTFGFVRRCAGGEFQHRLKTLTSLFNRLAGLPWADIIFYVINCMHFTEHILLNCRSHFFVRLVRCWLIESQTPTWRGTRRWRMRLLEYPPLSISRWTTRRSSEQLIISTSSKWNVSILNMIAYLVMAKRDEKLTKVDVKWFCKCGHCFTNQRPYFRMFQGYVLSVTILDVLKQVMLHPTWMLRPRHIKISLKGALLPSHFC